MHKAQFTKMESRKRKKITGPSPNIHSCSGTLFLFENFYLHIQIFIFTHTLKPEKAKIPSKLKKRKPFLFAILVDLFYLVLYFSGLPVLLLWVRILIVDQPHSCSLALDRIWSFGIFCLLTFQLLFSICTYTNFFSHIHLTFTFLKSPK